jgi:hypothetical protein
MLHFLLISMVVYAQKIPVFTSNRRSLFLGSDLKPTLSVGLAVAGGEKERPQRRDRL